MQQPIATIDTIVRILICIRQFYFAAFNCAAALMLREPPQDSL
jgi:hypothetical protein